MIDVNVPKYLTDLDVSSEPNIRSDHLMLISSQDEDPSPGGQPRSVKHTLELVGYLWQNYLQ